MGPDFWWELHEACRLEAVYRDWIWGYEVAMEDFYWCDVPTRRQWLETNEGEDWACPGCRSNVQIHT